MIFNKYKKNENEKNSDIDAHTAGCSDGYGRAVVRQG